jgi:hypothetical protein
MNRLFAFLICTMILSCQSDTESKTEKQNDETVDQNDSQIPTEIEEEKIELDTLLNSDDYLIIGEKSAKVKVVKENEVKNFPRFETLYIFRDAVILGKDIEFEDVKIYQKFHPKSFEDYPAEMYQGELADPDFSTNPKEKMFITAIKNNCKKGINFAGHYTLAIWGCGSPCQSGVVVDRITGKIYSGYNSSLSSEFKKDSKLIIRNIGAIDTTTNLIRADVFSEVYQGIWTGTKFKEFE